MTDAQSDTMAISGIAANVELVRRTLYAQLAAFDFNEPDVCAGDALADLECAIEECGSVHEARRLARGMLDTALPVAWCLLQDLVVLDAMVSEEPSRPARVLRALDELLAEQRAVLHERDEKDEKDAAPPMPTPSVLRVRKPKMRGRKPRGRTL